MPFLSKSSYFHGWKAPSYFTECYSLSVHIIPEMLHTVCTLHSIPTVHCTVEKNINKRCNSRLIMQLPMISEVY